MFVIGCISWLVGKLFDSKQTFNAALVVAAWAYMPRILGALARRNSRIAHGPGEAHVATAHLAEPSAVHGRGSDKPDPVSVPRPVRSHHDLGHGPSRIGFCITGKVPKGRAVVFAVLMWVIGAVPALFGSAGVAGGYFSDATMSDQGGVAFDLMPGAHMTTRSRPSRFAR